MAVQAIRLLVGTVAVALAVTLTASCSGEGEDANDQAQAYDTLYASLRGMRIGTPWDELL